MINYTVPQDIQKRYFSHYEWLKSCIRGSERMNQQWMAEFYSEMQRNLGVAYRELSNAAVLRFSRKVWNGHSKHQEIYEEAEENYNTAIKSFQSIESRIQSLIDRQNMSD